MLASSMSIGTAPSVRPAESARDAAGNLLLRALPEHERARLRSCLERVALKAHDRLARSYEPVTHVYFLESGVASVLARTGLRPIEVVIIGREGMTGSCVMLGVDATPYDCLVQVPGVGLRLRVDQLRVIIDECPVLRQRLLAYLQAFTVQIAQTVVSTCIGGVEERLARWLLMCHDRVDGDAIPLTHELLSRNLGVRRAGVTVALHLLEGEHVIRSRRSQVTILDRARLEQVAAGTYGVAESEYVRLIRDPTAAERRDAGPSGANLKRLSDGVDATK
jgi:CRP-like cAMP-binding protein